MKKLLVMFLSLTCLADISLTDPYMNSATRDEGQKRAEFINKQVTEGEFIAIKMLTQNALGILMKKAVANLHAYGFDGDANTIENEWFDEQYVLMDMRNLKDIGDHAPLSLWLALAYEVIERDLGVEVCKALHLSDIKTINYSLPIIFRPCSFPMDLVSNSRESEYKNHFAKGGIYYGLVPVLTYWSVEIGCMVGTNGLLGLICSPISTVAEKFMGNKLAPALSNRIWERSCIK